MPRLKPKIKRPPIPRKMYAEAMKKNGGRCTHPGCEKKGTRVEHIIPWYVVLEHTLDNLEPHCQQHAVEKNDDDQPVIKKIRRLTGYTKAQWTKTNTRAGRLPKRKIEGWRDFKGNPVKRHSNA